MGAPRILLTGFEPFDGRHLNPSERVVRDLAGEPPAGIRLATAILPVVFTEVRQRLDALFADDPPDALLMLGLASRRERVELEEIALNVQAAERPDNAGNVPANETIEPGGPLARRARLPSAELIERLRSAGIAGGRSFHAGTHCCNLALYHALGRLPGEVACGFVHLPCLPEMTAAGRPDQGAPALDLATQRRAIAVILEAIIARGDRAIRAAE